MSHCEVVRLLKLFPIGLFCLFVACGGGGSNSQQPARSLNYVNPPGTGFRLEVEPATNNTNHLMLNLVGPGCQAIQGIAFTLTSTLTQFTWGNPGGTDPYAKAGTALTLGAIPLFKTKRPTGADGDLQVGIFQTGAMATTLGNHPIVSVALDFPANSTLISGTQLTLGSKDAQFLDGQRNAQSITIAVGTLTAQ